MLLDLSQNVFGDSRRDFIISKDDANRIKLLNCFFEVFSSRKITKKLWIKNFKLTSKNFQLLNNVLKENKNLKEFGIINCEMRDEDLLRISKSLLQLPLSSLMFSQNEISAKSAGVFRNLIDFVEKKKDLVELNLSYNNIDDLFLEEFIKSL